MKHKTVFFVQGLCIRFADDFETSLDDWKPDPADSNIMNLCVVSEGTYEICSRTVAPQGISMHLFFFIYAISVSFLILFISLETNYLLFVD